jgi:hypothetical protein
MTTKSRIFFWGVNYRAKTDKIDMFISDAKHIPEMNSNTLILLAGVISFIRKVFDVAKEMSSAFYKARFT